MDPSTSDPSTAEQSPAERYAASRRRAAAPRLRQFEATLDFPLDEFQVEACEALEHGSGVLVAAPTGAGKTVVGEFAVHLGLAQGRKAFYTTPIKALSNQKYTDLVRRYGASGIGLLTGDTSVNGDASVVVMTTEVLRNMLYAGSPALAGLGYVVMDEVHYLADRARGAVWEEVIIHLPDDVALVSLSATVSNAEEFGDWLATVRGETAVVVSEHRPVPLGQHVLLDDRLLDLYARHVDPTDPGIDPPINPELTALLRRLDGGGPGYGPAGRGRRGGPPPDRTGRPGGRLRPTPTFAMVDLLDHAGLLPGIVFVFSRAGCQAGVERCVAAGLTLTTADERRRIRAVVERRCSVIDPGDLTALGFAGFVEALSRGVAAHHAGMLPLFKETVEELFTAGLVKVVFATETLALGVNMPARSVVLDQLSKWDGRQVADLTPGEYTQLTGRAGRRGIDTQGHAVVLARPGLDPVHLAGLASRRLYPLRSSFAPSFNMAVNLVAQVGRARAREVLETSFAQYQADRSVVAQARSLQQVTRALADVETTLHCHLGDWGGYDELRRALSAAEKGGGTPAPDPAPSTHPARAFTPGDVLLVPGTRRPTQVVVVQTPPAGTFRPGPTGVLGRDATVRPLDVTRAGGPVELVGHLRLPPDFDPRIASARKDLAARLRRSAATDPSRHGRTPRSADDDARIADLRRRLRAHPCHACPQRAEHLRAAAQRARLRAQQDALRTTITRSAGSIAGTFDAVCEVLVTLGYLSVGQGDQVAVGHDDRDAVGQGDRGGVGHDDRGPVGRDDRNALQVTDAGARLRRLYAESDLVVAELLRDDVLADLDGAQLAAVLSAAVYRSRREESAEPRVPGGADGRVGRALAGLDEAWARVAEQCAQAGLDTPPALDLGLVAAVHQWALGRSLPVVLRTAGLEAGDFVRWVKQLVDLLGQVAQVGADAGVRRAALAACDALRRGVVAYSTV